MAKHQNTLDLYGDLDDVELIMDVEQTFGVKITDPEAERLFTVGHLADLVKLSHSATRGAPCLSARAFRRMRAALPNGVRPDSPVSILGRPHEAKAVLLSLGKATGLDLDVTELRGTPEFVFWAILCAVPVLTFGMWQLVGPIAALWLATLAILPVISNFYRRVPAEIITLGELAHRSVEQNYDTLRGKDATGTQADIWHALCGICRFHSGHSGTIDRNTTFFSKTPPPVPSRKD